VEIDELPIASNIPDDATMQDFRRLFNAAMPQINQWDEVRYLRRTLASLWRPLASPRIARRRAPSLIVHHLTLSPHHVRCRKASPPSTEQQAAETATQCCSSSSRARIPTRLEDGCACSLASTRETPSDVCCLHASHDPIPAPCFDLPQDRMPLHEAAEAGHAAAVALLLKHGSNANAGDTVCGVGLAPGAQSCALPA